MELSQIARLVSWWARGKPLVKRVYLFGSRVRGDHGPDSDVDIAVELDPAVFRGVDESGGLATWMFETKEWKEELEKLIPLKVNSSAITRIRRQQSEKAWHSRVNSFMKKQPNPSIQN